MGAAIRSSLMRPLALLLLSLAAVALTGCLAVSAAGTVVGVGAKAAGAAVRAGGMVAGAVLP
jgi:hypothetical protein